MITSTVRDISAAISTHTPWHEATIKVRVSRHADRAPNYPIVAASRGAALGGNSDPARTLAASEMGLQQCRDSDDQAGRRERGAHREANQVRAALKEQGFAVLTEIDVQATLHEKLGEHIEPHLILGACNPPLAHRALTVDPSVGLLLPCNVVVRAHEGRTIVEALDPAVMVEVTGDQRLSPMATEASTRLAAALEAVAADQA